MRETLNKLGAEKRRHSIASLITPAQMHRATRKEDEFVTENATFKNERTMRSVAGNNANSRYPKQ